MKYKDKTEIRVVVRLDYPGCTTAVNINSKQTAILTEIHRGPFWKISRRLRKTALAFLSSERVEDLVLRPGPSERRVSALVAKDWGSSWPWDITLHHKSLVLGSRITRSDEDPLYNKDPKKSCMTILYEKKKKTFFFMWYFV